MQQFAVCKTISNGLIYIRPNENKSISKLKTDFFYRIECTQELEMDVCNAKEKCEYKGQYIVVSFEFMSIRGKTEMMHF